MIVIDTSAVVAILQEEPEAASFQACISGSEQNFMAAPTKFELMMVAARRPHGPYIAEDLIGAFGLQVIDWTDAHAELAIDAFLRFGRGRHPAALNFGDCMAYALAKALDAPLLYKGNDFSQTDITSAL